MKHTGVFFPPLPLSALVFVLRSPLHAPVDCGVVHLVDQDDQVLDAGRLGQHGVLPRLAALLKSRLELAFPRRDDLRAEHSQSRLEMQHKSNSLVRKKPRQLPNNNT